LRQSLSINFVKNIHAGKEKYSSFRNYYQLNGRPVVASRQDYCANV